MPRRGPQGSTDFSLRPHVVEGVGSTGDPFCDGVHPQDLIGVNIRILGGSIQNTAGCNC